jgi:hypothetical protein
MEGTAPFGRIGKALKPLVQQHGEAEVLSTWRRYLTTEPAKYVTPESFAAKYGTWKKGSRNGATAPRQIDHDDLAGWQNPNPISGRREGR